MTRRLGGLTRLAPRRLLPTLIVATAVAACRSVAPVAVPQPPNLPALVRLQRQIDGLLADPAFARGTWGILVKSLSPGETIYALNARKLLLPASAMKVVTLAVAADRLGWDYTYRTEVYTTGPVDHGVLDGDIVIVGSGDPTLDDWDGAASARFAEWATVLKHAGIERINGRVIGDDNAFDDDGLGAGWAWDDIANSYSTPVGALQFNENTAQIVVTPAAVEGVAPLVAVTPGAAPLMIVNRATTVNGASSLWFRPSPRSPAIEVGGTVPLATARIVRNVSVPNPTQYFVTAARDGLTANGVEVVGPALDVDDLPASFDRAALTARTDIVSPSLAGFAPTMMNLSQNLFAETLLKTLGLRATGRGTSAAGLEVIGGTLERWGVPAGDIIAADGSGLSRYNLVTAEGLVAILEHVFHDERLRETYRDSLPLAGVTGTLAERMRGTPAEANVRAKTGSFSNARALVGYVQTADRETLAFAILANNYGVEPVAIDRAIDAIAVSLAQFSRQ